MRLSLILSFFSLNREEGVSNGINEIGIGISNQMNPKKCRFGSSSLSPDSIANELVTSRALAVDSQLPAKYRHIFAYDALYDDDDETERVSSFFIYC